jgi:post-segregation antitoxin (ccd killing protein)
LCTREGRRGFGLQQDAGKTHATVFGVLARYRDKPYTNIKFKIDEKLKRDLVKTAKALGMSTSGLVRIAVERLLQRYKSELVKKTDASA